MSLLLHCLCSSGYKYFGLGQGGKCYSGPNVKSTYYKDGASNNRAGCNNGVGLQGYQYVYTLGKGISHIDFTHKKRQLYVWGLGEVGRGGGGLAAVKFLCDTSWEYSIILLKSFGPFGN